MKALIHLRREGASPTFAGRLAPLLALLAGFSALTATAELDLRKTCSDKVEIVSDDGQTLGTYGGLLLTFDKRYSFASGTLTTLPDGFAVTYAAPAGLPASCGNVCAKMTFRKTGAGVSVRYEVSGVASGTTFKAGLSMIGRQHAKGMARGDVAGKGGYWVRDAHGGIPYEEKLKALVVTYTNDVGGLTYVFGSGKRPNLGWQDPWNAHVGFEETSAGTWESTFRVFPTEGRDGESVALAASGQVAGVALSTPRTYNLFAAGEALVCTARVTSVRSGARAFDLAWWVRGFEGETFLSGTRRVTLKVGEPYALPLTWSPSETRGLYFVEVSAREVASGREAFARTNLARLPPFAFADGPERSPFGLAAYWPLPDEESAQALMDRMGVMWIRGGDTRKQHAPRRSNRHSSANVFTLTNEAERTAWIVKELEQCRTNQNEYWEFANELNMSTAGIALKSHGIGRGLAVPAYAAFLEAIDRIRRERGYEDVKVLSLGLAGYDGTFMRKMKEAGCWEKISGFCLHPGRGNFTPDYPYLRPERDADGACLATDDPTAAERLENSNFWNFLGAVRGVEAKIAEYGEMPLWLTEVYTPTYPNSFWEDTLRNAAENTVLSYALIKADGVKCGFYYQLFDSVWYDRLGVNPNDREYFFGLMNRDLSPKPSWMAYVAIAEALDGTDCLGWLKPSNATTHAVAFGKAGGETATVIAWDRTDGYVLTEKPASGETFKSPEPWVDRWKSRVTLTLPAKAGATAANAIGQEKPLAVSGGKAEIALSGAPTIVRGVDAAALRAAGGLK